ncbi:MAG: MBOAT family protein [Desulfatirhabdiaceae bacterium]
MVFSSVIFLFGFLPVALLIYFLSPIRFRNVMLLCLSLFFYAWGEAGYVVIMGISILMNSLFGWLMDRFSSRKPVLWTAIAANLALLGAFKYANFLVNNFNIIMNFLNIPVIHINPVHLPIGISFFTFQAMSYVIDVYRREVPAAGSPLHIGLYIALFPQLIAGPIVRYRDIYKQILHRSVTVEDFSAGVARFVYGMGKKVLLANTLAITADKIFAIPLSELTPPLAWLGIVCYTLQIYFDFSGYSDMAIGLGRMFGFTFLENFNFPYISRSIQEFWRRWHISLSTWFRDYLYIPLGGNRKGNLRTHVNLIIVFFLCGLWHGASWNFVVWGLFHGLFLVLERMGLEGLLNRMGALFRHLYVMSVVMVGWVCFRSDNLENALGYLSAMSGFSLGNDNMHPFVFFWDRELMVTLICAVLFSAPLSRWLKTWRERVFDPGAGNARVIVHHGLNMASLLGFIAVLLTSIASLVSGSYNPFIYFRF